MSNLTITCSTPHGIGANGTPALRACASGGGCAQRLTASGRTALFRPCVELRLDLMVLNASRHRGERHTASSQFRCTCRTARAQRLTASGRTAQVSRDGADDFAVLVLNASRHRGERHGGVRLIGTSGTSCSTPHGIGANGTRRSSRELASMAGLCSTPHGIGANGTRACFRHLAWCILRAQRLTASGRTAQRSTHKGEHMPGSAQRLTASGRTAREGAEDFGTIVPCVLNASRHRGERHRPARTTNKYGPLHHTVSCTSLHARSPWPFPTPSRLQPLELSLPFSITDPIHLPQTETPMPSPASRTSLVPADQPRPRP